MKYVKNRYQTKTPVRSYVRYSKGKPIRVKSHRRGVTRANYGFSPKTTNKQYRNWDSDKDGVKNINDCRPFDKSRQDEPNVITLYEIKTPLGFPPKYRIVGALASGPTGTMADFERLYPESTIRIKGEGEIPDTEDEEDFEEEEDEESESPFKNLYLLQKQLKEEEEDIKDINSLYDAQRYIDNLDSQEEKDEARGYFIEKFGWYEDLNRRLRR